MILIAIATLQVSAQEQKRDVKKQRMESKMHYSPEQMAQLQAKRMTLKLDLTDKQQKAVSALFLENAKLRQTKKEAYLQSKSNDEKKIWSKEERFQMANARLDHKIEMKKKMKTILSTEQFEKWGQMNDRRGHQSKKYAMRSGAKKHGMPREKAKQ